MNRIDLQSRYRGALLGLACGDAVGASVEFQPRGTFPPVTGMDGGGPFGLEPGEWTDDTSMALCLAASLLCQGGFDTTICRVEGVDTPKRLGATLHSVIEEYLVTHSPISPKIEGRCTATDAPNTLLTQLMGVGYEFR